MERRTFLKGVAVSSLILPIRMSLAAESSNIHIIDLANGPYFDRHERPKNPRLDGMNVCTKPNTKFIENLSKKGVDTVIRYFSDKNNAWLNCKNITKRERDLWHDHGMSLAIVYQYQGRSSNRYTGARAQMDAEFCLARAKIISQPEGSAIYFGVDADLGNNSQADVNEYFKIVNRVFDGRFQVGVYAAGTRCAVLKERGLAKLFWVPEAPAWDGTHKFMNSGDWTFYQNKTEVQKSYLAVDMGQEVKLDTDFINPLAGNSIGAFNKDGSEKTYDKTKLERIASSRYWVNRKKVNLRSSPNGPKVGHMCTARMVHVLGYEGNWAKVDIDEDGAADGFMHKNLLLPYDKMPSWISGSGCVPMKL